MCKKLCVFAGTTEGRELIELLEGESVSVTACVATEYGGSLLTPREGLTVSHERLTEEEMEKLFRRVLEGEPGPLPQGGSRADNAGDRRGGDQSFRQHDTQGRRGHHLLLRH